MRTISGDMLTALEAGVYRPFFLFKGVFDTDTIYLSSLNRNISWDSQTWLGNGWLQSFPQIVESNHLSIEALVIRLSGVPLSLIALALGQTAERNPGVLYFGLFDEDRAIIDDPIELFPGRLDQARIKDEIDNATLELTYESDLADFSEPRESRFTHESQRALFPTDLGFEHVVNVQNWNGLWGKPKSDKKKKDKKKKPKPSKRK